MQIGDLRGVAPGTTLTSDICLIGSGPAGFAIATTLAQTSVSVLVLESGGRDGESEFVTAQNEIETVGVPRVLDQSKVRNRILGGASHSWSGRCTALDAIDYEQRPWVNFSGWPLTATAMAPYLHRAAEHLGLTPTTYDERLLDELGLPRRFEEREGEGLRSVFWQFSRRSASDRDHVRFGMSFEKLKAPNIRLLTHATVINIHTGDEDQHVSELEVATPEGVSYQVRSRLYVLCAGGIENARLMLASNRVFPAGIGNRKGLVGRFLMDHPRLTIGTFTNEAEPALRSEFLLLDHASGARMQRGLSFSLERQRKEKLLNCAAWITQQIDDRDVWKAMRARLRDGRLARGRVALRHADQLVAGVWSKYVRRRPVKRRLRRIDLDVMVEQVPDPASRISLSEKLDPLGMPLSRIDWRIGEQERRTVMQLGLTIQRALAQKMLPSVDLAPWIRDGKPEEAIFHDPAHPTGTTRMSENESNGIVDRDSKVFGIDNLYVAGSSVFSTSGHANPTLMIVALALRLAEKLQTRYTQLPV